MKINPTLKARASGQKSSIAQMKVRQNSDLQMCGFALDHFRFDDRTRFALFFLFSDCRVSMTTGG